MNKHKFNKLKQLIITDGIAPITALKLMDINVTFAGLVFLLSKQQYKIIKPYMYKSFGQGYAMIGYYTDSRFRNMEEVLEETYNQFEAALATGQEININLY